MVAHRQRGARIGLGFDGQDIAQVVGVLNQTVCRVLDKVLWVIMVEVAGRGVGIRLGLHGLDLGASHANKPNDEGRRAQQPDGGNRQGGCLIDGVHAYFLGGREGVMGIQVAW